MKKAFLALFIACLTAPATAASDGLPVTGLDGSAGVVSHDGIYRYVTFFSGRDTVVARLHVDGGEIARSRTIAGRFSVPAVAYDSSGSGISADGSTLALIRSRVTIPQKRTHIVILDATRLRIQRTITLQGDFSFDAISPDGSKLFLVNYLSLTRHNFDPTKYTVRSLDAATGRLDPKPVIDPREPDEKMGGLPVTRTMSPDGRWAYTLYSGSEHPFVHALDTVGDTARCVDLDALTKRQDIFQLKLHVAAGGSQLQIVKNNKPVSLVDTRSFKVSAPVASPAVAQSARASHDDGPTLWPYALVLVLLVLIGAASARPLARATRTR